MYKQLLFLINVIWIFVSELFIYFIYEINEDYVDRLTNKLANLKTRPKNPVGENLENDLYEELHPIRPRDPVAKILESESHRRDGVRIHSVRPAPRSNAR